MSHDIERVQTIFEGALECAPEDRDAYLVRACAGDDSLREHVQRLIEADADEARESRLQSAVQIALGALSESRDDAGRVIGPYRLVEQLGRGGMGVVWLAERADDAYRTRVAIKLVSGGFLDQELARRFRAERQILAELHHPNIAALLDGGDAPDGTPYLVMEYVDGETITAYAERNELGLADRLALFRIVCGAVQHAHRSLVVHRDIKPANILVSSTGVPKLVDFGIARPLARESTETTALVRRMTPSYASPEQIRGERITVATDIYSLGVLLYELLTGAHPFATGAASTEEVRRRVLEEEPPLPSHVARRQGLQSGFGSRDLAGDIDNIVAKALRKRPEERYLSVEQLADDVRRYLDGEPVAARAPSVAYRARKFVGRHRASVAAASLLFVSLVGGLAATTWQGRRAERARATAQAASEQATAVKDFLTSLFRASDPSVAAGREVTVRDLLDRGTQRVDALEDKPALQADLLNVLAVVQINVGNYGTANNLLDREVQIRRTLPADSMLVGAINQRGRAFDLLGMPDSASAYFREAIDVGRNAIGVRHGIVRAAMNNLAIAYGRLGREEEAAELYRELIPLDREILGPDHVDRSFVLNNYGLMLTHQGRYAEAEPLLTEALRLREAADSNPSVGLGFALDNLGMMLRTAGRYDESEPFIRRGLTVRRQVLGDDHRFTGESYFSLGWMLALRGRENDLAESDSLLRAALENYRRNLGIEHPAMAYVHHALAMLEEKRGNLDEAERRFREALAIRRAAPRDNPRVTVQTLIALGQLRRRRNGADAAALLREADSIATQRLGDSDPIRAQASTALHEYR